MIIAIKINLQNTTQKRRQNAEQPESMDGSRSSESLPRVNKVIIIQTSKFHVFL